MSKPKYYTTFQASKLLGVSLATVVNWTKAGLLDAHRTPGGHRRISESNLVAFAKAYEMPLDPDLVEAHDQGGTRVLLVDDDEAFLETTQLVLQSDGCRVETAHSGFAAGLAIARFKPTCIFLDLRMPGMDGFEVAEMLRAKPFGRAIPVVACTGFLDDATRARVDREFDGLLLKPLEIEVVRSLIASLPLQSRRVAN